MSTMGTDRPGDDGDRRLAMIRSLLSKAEATDYPEEAEAFFAKASELISRWAIDEAAIWAGADRSGREQPDELQLVVHAPYLPQKAVLIGAVASSSGCRAVRLVQGPGTGTEIVSVVGFPSDLRWVETLVTSLLVQLTSAMLAGCPSGLRPAESASWRRSFIVGFAEEVGARLEADRAAAAAEQSPAGSADATGAPRSAAHAAARSGSDSAPISMSLVLAERADEVDDDFRRRHPRVRSSWASGGRSAGGRRAGRAAGKDASFTRHSVGGRRALGRR